MLRNPVISPLWLILLTLGFRYGHTQVTRTEGFVDANLGRPYSLIEEVPLKPPTIGGEIYHSPTWNPGEVYVVGGDTLVGVPIKYDLLRDQLHIFTPQGIRVLDESQIEGMRWRDSLGQTYQRFVHRRHIRGSLPNGGAQLLFLAAEGKWMDLWVRPQLRLQEKHYNIQIDMGKREATWKRLDQVILQRKDHFEVLPKGRRNVFRRFAPFQEEMKSFSRLQSLSHKKVEDLALMVLQYNCWREKEELKE